MANFSVLLKWLLCYLVLLRSTAKPAILIQKYIQCHGGGLTIIEYGPFAIVIREPRICLPTMHLVVHDSIQTPINKKAEQNNSIAYNDTIYCPLEYFGLFPHPFSNQKYLKCVNGRLYDKSCRNGFVFNFISKFCIKNNSHLLKLLPSIQDRYHYSGNSIIQTRSNDSLTFLECPNELDGTFIHPFNCSQYIKCSLAGTKVGSCSNSEIYNFRTEKCEIESNAEVYNHIKCIKRDVNPEPEDSFSYSLGVVCAATGSRNYSHPRTERKYVNCHNGKLHVRQCSRSEVFSLEAGNCIIDQIMVRTHMEENKQLTGKDY